MAFHSVARSQFAAAIVLLFCSQLSAGETLYNGIELPAVWPPLQTELSKDPLATPPYLTTPPEVIRIDVGRQLFVDDFLIDKTTLTRRLHQAEYHPKNPVLSPEQPWERKGGPARAAVFSDGANCEPVRVDQTKSN